MAEKLDGPGPGTMSKRRFSSRVVVSRQKAVGAQALITPLTDGEEILVFPPLAGG